MGLGGAAAEVAGAADAEVVPISTAEGEHGEGGEEGEEGEGRGVAQGGATGEGPGLAFAPLVCTERSVSALQNWAILSVAGLPKSRAELSRDVLRLGAELHAVSGGAVRLLNASQPGGARVLDGDGVATLRHACRRVVYRYALPYALLRPRTDDAAGCGARPAPGGGANAGLTGVFDGACSGQRPEGRGWWEGGGLDSDRKGAWLSNLGADGLDAGQLSSALQELFGAVLGPGLAPEGIDVPDCGGYCLLRFASAEAAASAVSCLDGYAWRGTSLLALPMGEAREKLRIHQQAKAALKRLTDARPVMPPARDGHRHAVAKPEAEATTEREGGPEEDLEVGDLEVGHPKVGDPKVGDPEVGEVGDPKVGDLGDPEVGDPEGGQAEETGGKPEVPRAGAATAPAPAQKRRARCFDSFASDKRRLKGTGPSLSVLGKCYSSIHEDLRGATRHVTATATAAADVAADVPRWAAANPSGDCLVLSFAAREFAHEQVRRMAATVAAVVSGRLGPDFIDRCFDTPTTGAGCGGGGGALATTAAAPPPTTAMASGAGAGGVVRTPLAPAAAMWLEQVHLAPRAAGLWAASLPPPATCAAPPAITASPGALIDGVPVTPGPGAKGSIAAQVGEQALGKQAIKQAAGGEAASAAVLAECRAVRASVLSAVAAAACTAAATGWLDEELRAVLSQSRERDALGPY